MTPIDYKKIFEEYSNSTEQMNKILKDAKKLQALIDKNREVRVEFLQNVLGKTTYKKYDKAGLFAPVPLNAIKLNFRDFADLNPEFNTPAEKTERLIQYLREKYYRYKDLYYSENADTPIRTDIVFDTIDSMIDFFYNVLSAYCKVFRSEDINWKPFVKKFRSYLN